ncbi:PRC-barrel domain containing protein [Agromyces laixinhei]|uniref:PRC-barrel domain containing protein n=1 Tax=Agromyces laixinhei TaxID=2585717 RepID=UPI0012ED2E8A|nr:PRC-barrel domain containing protein [Agromyces laixinhei]
MILGDLLQAKVLDASGERLGWVIDVRFVLDGTVHETLADARLSGLIVSPRTKSSYWGFERHSQDSPALIARYLRWRHRGSFLVPWPSVAMLRSDGAVVLRAEHDAYDPAL